jgi:hypothetical protein
VMAHLTWNPSADASALLADYYVRAFGPAAPAVREYYESLEKARMAYTAKAPESEIFDFPKLYTEELLKESQARLDRAAAAAPAGSLYARRVAFVQAGLTYTQLQIENIRLMSGWWKKKDDSVAAKVRANWDQVDELIAANPYAINAAPVRPATPRMQGMHPDHGPAKKKKTRKANDLDLN